MAATRRTERPPLPAKVSVLLLRGVSVVLPKDIGGSR
jgi:hypothetical protein